ncbi:MULTISPECIES: hypothetical protein [unclassified Virgibacillus]|nr:hypothetical protein [Virgibacillus sp. LDC-1]
MKKLIVSMALGAVLTVGFLFAQDNPVDLTMDAEPSIFSVGKPVYEF